MRLQPDDSLALSPSDLSSEGTYEPVETKLARSAKPAHVLQLAEAAGAARR